MRLRCTVMLLAGLVCGVMPGCGDEPAPPPTPTVSAPATESGPKIPSHGIAVIVPSRAAERGGADVGFDALAEAELALANGERAESVVVQAGEAFGQPGRLRFYLEPVNERTDEQADARITEIFDELATALDESFRRRLNMALRSSVNQQATLREQVAEAQSAYSSYLASRRGIPDTPESRREKARLDHALESATAALLQATQEVDRLRELVEAQPTALRRVR